MAIIVDAVRTPIGRVNQSLSHLTASELGSEVVKALLKRNGLTCVDEVIFSNCFNSNFGNIARIVTLKSGMPISVPSICIDRRCSSSLDAVAYAAMLIDTGNADIVIAGGTESCSKQPLLVSATNYEPIEVIESPNEIGNPSMIQSAENIANQYSISREECDEYAFNSHLKAKNYYEKGLYTREIVCVSSEGKIIDRDECIRFDTTLEKIRSLKPVIENGTVTAGNCTPKNDGASAVLVVSERLFDKYPKGYRIDGFAAAGCDPNLMGLGPIYSTQKLLEQRKMSIDSFDLFEINEAFAVQVIACKRMLGISDEKLNVFGGAIAFGHPYAASGGILISRLINALDFNSLNKGLVSFCCGGGQGFSMALSRV